MSHEKIAMLAQAWLEVYLERFGENFLFAVKDRLVKVDCTNQFSRPFLFVEKYCIDNDLLFWFYIKEEDSKINFYAGRDRLV